MGRGVIFLNPRFIYYTTLPSHSTNHIPPTHTTQRDVLTTLIICIFSHFSLRPRTTLPTHSTSALPCSRASSVPLLSVTSPASFMKFSCSVYGGFRRLINDTASRISNIRRKSAISPSINIALWVNSLVLVIVCDPGSLLSHPQ